MNTTGSDSDVTIKAPRRTGCATARSSREPLARQDSSPHPVYRDAFRRSSASPPIPRSDARHGFMGHGPRPGFVPGGSASAFGSSETDERSEALAEAPPGTASRPRRDWGARRGCRRDGARPMAGRSAPMSAASLDGEAGGGSAGLLEPDWEVRRRGLQAFLVRRPLAPAVIPPSTVPGHPATTGPGSRHCGR